MRIRPPHRLLAACVVVLAATCGVATAQPGPYAPYPPYPYAGYGYGLYPYGGVGAWGCGGRPCYDDAALRRALQQQQLRDEIERRSGSASAMPDIHPAPRYAPPATPDSQLQPRYRGTGEIRPEFDQVGRQKPDATK